MHWCRKDVRRWLAWLAICSATTTVGCNSPYRSDQGALLGGLGGAGVGALVGNAVGKTGAGAAIGAGVGALSGAVVGGSLDEIEARNRAEIEARLGRPVAAGAVTNDDVIAMTRSGVSEEVIVNHVRSRGVVAPLQASDLVFLTQQGVSPRVIQAMQAPPVVQAGPPVIVPAPPPAVIVADPWYPPPYYWGPPCYRYRRPGVHWGVGFSN